LIGWPRLESLSYFNNVRSVFTVFDDVILNRIVYLLEDIKIHN